jgi:hypothetical protein
MINMAYSLEELLIKKGLYDDELKSMLFKIKKAKTEKEEIKIEKEINLYLLEKHDIFLYELY